MQQKRRKGALQSPETIAAIATAPGQGGIGVVRLSGADLSAFSKALLGFIPKARQASFTPFVDEEGNIIDQGIAIYFPAPHSYTGEDVLELQGHGGVAVLHSLLNCCIRFGARLAQPGEFTLRAFLNGKMDLAQAESVADLIAATTQQAARSAIRSLQGDFSKEIQKVVLELIELRVHIEATIDFPEEEGVPPQDLLRMRERLQAVLAQLNHIRSLAKQGILLREGAQIVLVGSPNVGKSSLLNHLAGEEVALVSEMPGTTRDSIRQALQIGGVPLHLVDTAGIRKSDDVVEQMGIARTMQHIEKADMVLVLIDETNPVYLANSLINANLKAEVPVVLIHNKIDLIGTKAKIDVKEGVTHLYLSAKTGEGISLLKDIMLKSVGWHQESDVLMARARHLEAIDIALGCLSQAEDQLNALELFAESTRQAQLALNQITGEFMADDLLGKIFGQFCIGK